MSVALFTHPGGLDHDTGEGHPECPERLRAVLRALQAPEFAGLLRESAPVAPTAALAAVHGSRHVERIMAAIPSPGRLARLDGDTVIGAGSFEAASRAAGAAIAAVDAVMQNRAGAAFCAMRPPGHHAERERAMGFCLFNNAAIAALHARAAHGLRRIAVADFDVHHGNGTQDIFAADPELFYASSHQSPCYPGTGAADERGISGNVLNLPLPPGTAGPAFRAGWRETLLPAIEAFAPELLIISAGFDAHAADPLAQLQLDEADFAWITGALLDLADRVCPGPGGGGRVVSLLEGGYDLTALAASAAAHLRGLMRL